MKILRYGIAIGMLAGLGACSDMMGSSGSSSRAAATQPTIAPAMVKQVQSKLRDDGYYKQGAVDGVWGAGTENAVRSYQRDHNLSSNGQLDVPTLQAMNITSGSSMNNNDNPSNPSATRPMNNNPPATAPMNTNPPMNNDVNPRTDTTTSPPPR